MMRAAQSITRAVTNRNVEASKRNPFVVNALAGPVRRFSLFSHAGPSKLANKAVSAAWDRPTSYQQLLSARSTRDAAGDDKGFVTNSAKPLGSYFTKQLWRRSTK